MPAAMTTMASVPTASSIVPAAAAATTPAAGAPTATSAGTWTTIPLRSHRNTVRCVISIEVRFVTLFKIRAAFDGYGGCRCHWRCRHGCFRRSLATAHLRALLLENRLAR